MAAFVKQVRMRSIDGYYCDMGSCVKSINSFINAIYFLIHIAVRIITTTYLAKIWFTVFS